MQLKVLRLSEKKVHFQEQLRQPISYRPSWTTWRSIGNRWCNFNGWQCFAYIFKDFASKTSRNAWHPLRCQIAPQAAVNHSRQRCRPSSQCRIARKFSWTSIVTSWSGPSNQGVLVDLARETCNALKIKFVIKAQCKRDENTTFFKCSSRGFRLVRFCFYILDSFTNLWFSKFHIYLFIYWWIMVQRVSIFSSSDYMLNLLRHKSIFFLCNHSFTRYIILWRPVILLYANMMKILSPCHRLCTQRLYDLSSGYF